MFLKGGIDIHVSAPISTDISGWMCGNTGSFGERKGVGREGCCRGGRALTDFSPSKELFFLNMYTCYLYKNTFLREKIISVMSIL